MQPPTILFANTKQRTVTTELNVLLILVMLLMDATTPTKLLKDAHQEDNVLRMQTVSNGDSPKNLERNAKKLSAILFSGLVLFLQKIKFVFPRLNANWTVLQRTHVKRHIAMSTQRETTIANVLQLPLVMMEMIAPLTLVNH